MATSPPPLHSWPLDAHKRERVEESDSDREEAPYSVLEAVQDEVQELTDHQLEQLVEYLLENTSRCDRCWRRVWDRHACFLFLPEAYCHRCIAQVRQHRERLARRLNRKMDLSCCTCRLCEARKPRPALDPASDSEE